MKKVLQLLTHLIVLNDIQDIINVTGNMNKSGNNSPAFFKIVEKKDNRTNRVDSIENNNSREENDDSDKEEAGKNNVNMIDNFFSDTSGEIQKQCHMPPNSMIGDLSYEIYQNLNSSSHGKNAHSRIFTTTVMEKKKNQVNFKVIKNHEREGSFNINNFDKININNKNINDNDNDDNDDNDEDDDDNDNDDQDKNETSNIDEEKKCYESLFDNININMSKNQYKLSKKFRKGSLKGHYLDILLSIYQKLIQTLLKEQQNKDFIITIMEVQTRNQMNTRMNQMKRI